jgi:hypothetical protein
MWRDRGVEGLNVDALRVRSFAQCPGARQSPNDAGVFLPSRSKISALGGDGVFFRHSTLRTCRVRLFIHILIEELI